MSIRRYARVEFEGRIVSGVVVDDEVHGDDVVVPLQKARLLTPVTPSKIVAIALNYRAHAAEMKKPIPEEPMFFFKPLTALIGPGDAIQLPPASAEVHFEGEMGIVVGKKLTRASVEEARDAVYGVTCINDVTARDIQRRQNHYTRAKGYDTFCPIGPYVVTGLDPTDLAVRTRVNGEIKQDGRTNDMIFGVYELLSFVSQVMTLLPGDVISTGTPPGVGPIRAGDTVSIEVEGVGVLENRVVG